MEFQQPGVNRMPSHQDGRPSNPGQASSLRRRGNPPGHFHRFFKYLHSTGLTTALLVLAACSPPTPRVEEHVEIPAVETPALQQPSISTMPAEHRPAQEDKIIASFDGLHLYTTEYYLHVNKSIGLSQITDLEMLMNQEVSHWVTLNVMVEKAMRREAEHFGANDDEWFALHMRNERQEYFFTQAASVLKPTLPEAGPADTSPPTEQELQDAFFLWQNQIVKKEPIWLHYIVFSTHKDNIEGNRIQQDKAERALARIRGGEEFLDVLMEVTEHENPTREPYMLLRRDRKLKELREIIEIMQPGEISDVVKRSKGYFIFYVLPGQEWTDLSSLETVKANPPLFQQLVDHIISLLRPWSRPVDDYIDANLKDQPGFEEFDMNILAKDEMPPMDTVLVKIRDKQWTMAELDLYMRDFDTTVDSLTPCQVRNAIRNFGYHMLLVDQVERELIKLDDESYHWWEIMETGYYTEWLGINLWKIFVAMDPVLAEDPDYMGQARQHAMDHIDHLKQKVVGAVEVHKTPGEIDINRLKWFVPPSGPGPEPIEHEPDISTFKPPPYRSNVK
jgi:hypothetical protein